MPIVCCGSCEFWHPKAPDRTASKKICEYFQSARGCVKDDRCDFLHIVDEQKATTARSSYDRAPMGAPMFGQYGAPPNGGGEGTRPAKRTKAQEVGNTRVCDFYQSARGCAKDERCDFIHQAGAAPHAHHAQAPPGVMSVSAVAAAHQAAAAQYAAATAAAGGYEMPNQDYGAAAAYGAYGGYPLLPLLPLLPRQPTPMPTCLGMICMLPTQLQLATSNPLPAGSNRGTCSFFASGKGCRKGDRCDFAHPSAAPTHLSCERALQSILSDSEL